MLKSSLLPSNFLMLRIDFLHKLALSLNFGLMLQRLWVHGIKSGYMELGILCYARSHTPQMRQLMMEVGLLQPGLHQFHAGEAVVVGNLGSTSTLKFLPTNQTNWDCGGSNICFNVLLFCFSGKFTFVIHLGCVCF
jgi:hypothetical protein